MDSDPIGKRISPTECSRKNVLKRSISCQKCPPSAGLTASVPLTPNVRQLLTTSAIKAHLTAFMVLKISACFWVEWVGPATDFDPADNGGVVGFYQRYIIAVPPKAKDPVSHADGQELSTLDRSGSLFALASFHSPSQKHRYLVVVEGVGSLEVYRK